LTIYLYAIRRSHPLTQMRRLTIYANSARTNPQLYFPTRTPAIGSEYFLQLLRLWLFF
jgi:hypothetical protein